MVEADVAEANIHQVKVGQPVEILLDALPGVRFPGKVHMIVPTADRSKATIMVKAAFDSLDPRILPEMSAKVAFLARPLKAREEEPRLVINPKALVQRNGNLVAFVLKDQKVQATPVEVGPQLGEWLEVKKGLDEGDKVVIQPPNNLHDGDQVRVIEG